MAFPRAVNGIISKSLLIMRSQPSTEYIKVCIYIPIFRHILYKKNLHYIKFYLCQFFDSSKQPCRGTGLPLPLFKCTDPGEQLGLHPCKSAEDSSSWQHSTVTPSRPAHPWFWLCAPQSKNIPAGAQSKSAVFCCLKTWLGSNSKWNAVQATMGGWSQSDGSNSRCGEIPLETKWASTIFVSMQHVFLVA